MNVKVCDRDCCHKIIEGTNYYTVSFKKGIDTTEEKFEVCESCGKEIKNFIIKQNLLLASSDKTTENTEHIYEDDNFEFDDAFKDVFNTSI